MQFIGRKCNPIAVPAQSAPTPVCRKCGEEITRFSDKVWRTKAGSAQCMKNYGFAHEGLSEPIPPTSAPGSQPQQVAPIPDDLRDQYEDSLIGAANYGESVTGNAYRSRAGLIERIGRAEAALEKVRSHLLTATHPVSKGSDEMLVSAKRVFDAFEYVGAALAATSDPPPGPADAKPHG